MTKRIISLGIAAILVMGITAIAFAAPLSQKLGARPGICGQLDLSDEQYSKMQNIREGYFEEHQDLRNKIAKETFELKSIYLPDEKAIKQKEEQIEKLRGQMNELRNKQFNEVNNILTKEQQEKLNGSRNNHKAQCPRRYMGKDHGFCNEQGQGRGMKLRGRF